MISSLKNIATNKLYKAISIILIILISGCKHTFERLESSDFPKLLTSVSSTRVVLLKTCPISGSPTPSQEAGFLSSLIGIIGPTLIDSTVGALGSAIKQAAGEHDEHTFIEAEVNDYFLENSKFSTIQAPKTKCLVFIDGVFGSRNSEGELNLWEPEGYERGDINKAVLNSLKIKGVPRFYMEAFMVVPEGRGEFEIKPQYLIYNKKLNSLGTDNKRDIEVRIQLTQIGENDKKMGSIGSFVLLDVPVGHYLGSIELAGIKTGFMSVPPKDQLFSAKESARNALYKNFSILKKYQNQTGMPKDCEPYMSTSTNDSILNNPDWTSIPDVQDVNKAIIRQECLISGTGLDKCKKQEKIAQFKRCKEILTKRKDYRKDYKDIEEKLSQENYTIYGAPFSLKITVTETRDINKWLLAIGEALTKNKEAISKATSSLVIPSEREAAKDLEKNISNTNNSAYLSAMLDVEIAQVSLTLAEKSKDEVLVLTKKKELINAKARANVAAITAGKSIPFPELL